MISESMRFLAQPSETSPTFTDILTQRAKITKKATLWIDLVNLEA